MRRQIVVLVCAGALGACSLLVDTNGLSGGASDASDGSAVDAGQGGADSGVTGLGDTGTTSAYATAVLADSPRAYWRMNEQSGATLGDATGNGNIVTLHGGVQLGVAGAIANDPSTAARFDGKDGFGELDGAFDFTGTSPYTLEAWIRPEMVDSDFRMVFSKDAYDANGREEYALFVSSGELAAERIVSAAQISAGATEMVNVWTHVVVAYDGSLLNIYVNAVLKAAAPDARSQPSKPVPFIVGAEDTTPNGPFEGSLDELAVYDKALSADRVKAHYEIGIGASK